MPSGLPRVYVDTNIVQPLIYNSDNLSDKQFAREVLENLRGDVSSGNIEVVIPKPAIGELVNNFYSDVEQYGEATVGSWSDLASQMSRYFDQTDAILCGISRDTVATANRLTEMDTRLYGTDAIIAACALEDNWSNHLVTEDPDFHETNAIQSVNEERQPTPRLHSLNITDSY